MELDIFTKYLQDEFCRRCRQNQNYSLRAYARNLGIDHGALSEIIRGRRRLTAKNKVKLSKSLGLGPQALQINGAQSASEKEFKNLTADAFAVVSDWFHFAILELTRVKGFKKDPKWIAKRLGITATEATTAIMRLKNLELLREEKGRLISSGDNTNIQSNEFTDTAKRNFQKTVILKALDAINTTHITERNQTSLTFAFNSKLLPEAIAKISQFRRQFSAEMNKGGPYDTIYNLGISLYPLTKPEKQNGKS